MGLPVEVNPLFLENQYAIQRSLRFRSSASANLTRTPASDTSGTKCTFSAWIKLGSLSTAANNGSFITDATTGNVYGQYYNNALYFGNASYYVSTAAVFRDFSSWYHVLFVVDSTLATTNDRMQIWVNGVRQAVGTFNTQPGLNSSVIFLNNTYAYQLGGRTASGSNTFFDGYLAEVNFADGQALAATAFGYYNEFGVWSPRKYGGSYGTNGFYLQFTDIALTSGSNAGLGKDFSGNTNYWTTNNISVTAGVTYDAMTDVPTPLTIQNVAAGNYCVLNPLAYDRLYPSFKATISNGNLQAVTSAGGAGDYSATIGTMGVSSGKFYWEMVGTAGSTLRDFGITDATLEVPSYPGGSARSWGYASNARLYNNGSFISYGATYTTNDIIGVALDLNAGTLVFYKNGVSQGTAATGLSGTFTPILSDLESGVSSTIVANFGQRAFSYTPPSGFLPLNTNNLPSPTIPNGAKVMAATTYAGTSSSNPVSNSSNNTLGTTFQPDFVWIKNRNYTSGTNHVLIDSVRGISNGLASNLTNGDFSTTGNFSSINPTGFTVAGTTRDYNFLNDTFVGWQWNAGSGTSTVPSGGTITPTGASINVSAGFSIIAYTGNGVSNASIAHGLGATPLFLITKCRSSATDWVVNTTATGSAIYLFLNTTAAGAADTGVTPPTSTLFYRGGANTVNGNGLTYVTYLWAPVSGYSAFGSYTGNGSTDGPFVFTNIRTRWLMIKRTDTTSDWTIFDTSRNTHNVSNLRLWPNLSDAESSTSSTLDILSNGFKLRTSDAFANASGGTYIYASFAENPFRMALAR
jgi:hypothetical protein